MAIRRTTKLLNNMLKGFGVKDLLSDGRIFVYTGSQPSSPDAEPSGTHLLTFTLNGNAFTEAVKSLASITIGGASVGTIDSVTVGGMGFNLLSAPVSYTTSAAITAGLIADNINARQNPLNISAYANATVLELTTPAWIGVGGNGLTFATITSGSLTATATGTFVSGTSAINGINFAEAAVDGVITKETSSWQGTGLSSNTAGWFRFVSGGSDSTGGGNVNISFDGTVGTSNADMIISSTAIVIDSVYTISTGTITEPTE